MLFPQFSLRLLLGVITAFSGFFLVVSFAAAGHAWAIAVAIGIGSLTVALAVYVATFFVVWLFSLLIPVRKAPVVGQSPFVVGAATGPFSREPSAAVLPDSRPPSPLAPG